MNGLPFPSLNTDVSRNIPRKKSLTQKRIARHMVRAIFAAEPSLITAFRCRKLFSIDRSNARYDGIALTITTMIECGLNIFRESSEDIRGRSGAKTVSTLPFSHLRGCRLLLYFFVLHNPFRLTILFRLGNADL